MARGTGWAQAAADGIMGYVKGLQLQTDMDRQSAADKRVQEEHDSRMADVQQKADVQAKLKSAAAPVEVQEGAGGMVKPASADNSDVGQPDGPGIAQGGLLPGYAVGDKVLPTREAATKAAADYNSPDAIMARQVSVMRAAGDPLAAAQLNTANVQGKAAQVTLDKEHRDMVDHVFDQHLSAVQSGDDLAKVLSGSDLVGGKQVAVVQSPDGKKAQLVYQDEQGNQVKYGKEFDNTADGVRAMVMPLSKTMTVGQKVQAAQTMAQFDESKRHNQASEGLEGRRLDESMRHDKVSEGLQGAEVGLRRDTLQWDKDKFDKTIKNDPAYALPAATKTIVSSYQSSIKSIDEAIARAQATPGGWDPKDPGAQELLQRRAAISTKLEGTLSQYQKGGASGGVMPASFKGNFGSGQAPGTNPGNINAAPPGAVTLTGGKYVPSVVGAAQAATPTAPAGGVAPGSTPAPAVNAAPQRDPVIAALNPSGNAQLDAVSAPRAQSLRDAGTALKAAQAQVVQAAQKGGDVSGATAQAQSALNALDQLTADMDPATAKRVRDAALM